MQEEDLVLSIPEMDCEECVQKINSALDTLGGVCHVRADLATKTVRLHYHPDQLSRGQIETELAGAGYPVAS